MSLSDSEWNVLVDAITTRDLAGCRGLRRLYGDWTRTPRLFGAGNENLAHFVESLGKLLGTLGKTLEKLGGSHMSFFDGGTTHVWAHVCRRLPGILMQALREFKLIGAAEFAVWGRAMQEAGPDVFAPNLDRLIFYNMQMSGGPIECLSRKFARGD